MAVAAASGVAQLATRVWGVTENDWWKLTTEKTRERTTTAPIRDSPGTRRRVRTRAASSVQAAASTSTSRGPRYTAYRPSCQYQVPGCRATKKG